ncbi:hypothetical protein MMC22_006571 [Lobaria immixta]|nr:hypothetical protein [Lobaria immixta]
MAYDVLGSEGAPLANTIFSTAGKPSQPSFPPDGNSAIEAFMHGPFVGHVGYNDSTVNEHNDGLPVHNASLSESFRMAKDSQSLSLVNRVQLNSQLLRPFVPTEAASTIVSPPVSLATSLISSPAPPHQTPTIGALSPPRHICATCSETFRRPADMRRHALKHNPSARRYDCLFPGCRASGFLRRDKLADHVKNMHQ